ncbi:MAG: DUF2057 family protein [Moraxella sp.]|nr:DUF2057 family protein [Moraxella sp.]
MKRFLISLATVCATMGAHAAVTLNVDDNIKVTAINGQAITQSPFQPLKKHFTLEAGRHVITARYDRLYDLSNKDHDVLRSSNITVSADLADNQTYRLVMPNQPERYEDAKEYIKAPSLAIMSGNTIIAEEKTTAQRTGLLSGLGGWFGRGSDKAVLENQQAINAINTAPAPQPPTQAHPNSTLDSFMQLWLNASDEEREKIRQWVQK